MKSTLITVRPPSQEKGFERTSLRIEDFTAVEQKAQQAISGYLSSLPPELPSDPDLASIRRSYSRLLRSEPMSNEDYVLSGHELLECARLTEHELGRYLAYRYRYNVFPKLQRLDRFPPCLQLEPTSVCNFRCIMCYQADPSFSHVSQGYMGHMSLDLFKRIIDQAHGNIEAVTMASRGEPLLNKDLPAMLEYCRGKFLALKLNTNGSLLNEKNIHSLLSSDLQTLVFSIDSADKATYEAIRVNGRFEKVKANLELFVKIKSEHYPRSRLITRISGVRINQDQKSESMARTWGGIADSITFVNYTPWESSYTNPPNEVVAPCSDLWRSISVWWDGRANPCDLDYKSQLSKWNVNDLSISEIWTSKEYQDLRDADQARRRSSIEPCRRCVVT